MTLHYLIYQTLIYVVIFRGGTGNRFFTSDSAGCCSAIESQSDLMLSGGECRLRQMIRIRLIEEAIADKYNEQEMRCPVHLSIGHEAPAVGICTALKKSK